MPNNLDEYTGSLGEETDLMWAEAFPQPEDQRRAYFVRQVPLCAPRGSTHSAVHQITYTANGR